MDVIYLAFANDSTNPLPTLREEDQKLNSLLEHRSDMGHFKLKSDSFASISQILSKIGDYKKDLRIFLYSGHAGEDKLHLEGEDANAEGLAYLLSQCPQLQLVFLNGCSTRGQVFNLLQSGVPVVIATSAPINDKKASEFSTRFFQALNDQSSIKEAFELAKGEIMTRYADIKPEMHSLLKKPGAEDASESLWGLYALPEKEISLQWKLNANTASVEIKDFVPNKLLIESLSKFVTSDDDSSNDVADNFRWGAKSTDEEKSAVVDTSTILQSLPQPISVQFRKLFAEGNNSGSGQTFYNMLGSPRLKQIIVIFNTAIELLGFTILADLWEAKAGDDKFITSESSLDKLKKSFLSAVAGTSTQQFFDLCVATKEIMDSQGLKFFIEEMAEVADAYQARGPLYEAVSYLELVHEKLEKDAITNDEVNEICAISEEKLAILFDQIGFIMRYTMVSIKDIDVRKYKRFITTQYIHNFIRLELNVSGTMEPKEFNENEALDSNSVLIAKKGNLKNSLNLSPFIIDENSFDNKAKIVKLYYFDRYDKPSDSYVYKHVYAPQDPPLLVQKQKYFTALRGQFDAFAKSIFNQSFIDL